MTTQSWSTRIRMDSDATFREYGAEFNAMLAAAGLVQTADTGQINWVTVNRPAINSDAGYEVWRMNDAMQATAPVFFRFAFGANNNQASPRLRVTVGTSTNGAGTLGGTALSTERQWNPTNANETTDTARQSFLCVNEGFFGLAYKTGAGAQGSFFFNRTCDSDGTPNADGAMIVWGSGGVASNATQAMRYAATAQAFTAQTNANTASMALGINPQLATTTAVGSDIQCMMGWTIMPRVSPLFGVCGVVNSEISAGSTFSVALVGSTARTYIGLTNESGNFGPVSSSATGGLKYAMLWE